MELQPSLKNDLLRLEPLRSDQFEQLFAVAADPLIWELHPAKDRYKREVFQGYFESGIASGGAFAVYDAKTGELIGCSRYYDVDPPRSVAIGFTFLARKYWGGEYNRAMKTLMLDHAFQFVDAVIFHVGRDNLRSRAAMLKIGGVFKGEIDRAIRPDPTVWFEIPRDAWRSTQAKR